MAIYPDLVIQPIRRPVWSGPLTGSLAPLIPVERRPLALTIIKVAHTLIFVSVLGCIAVVDWDGLRGRGGRQTVVAAAVTVIETTVFVSNNMVCPLTPLAESLGAGNGSVTDLYLPGWLSRRIPLLSGSAFSVGLLLHLRAWLGRRSADRQRA